MELFPAPEHTLAGALADLRAGRRSCRDVLEACLDRIDAREAEVRAWAALDRDGARAQADRLDADFEAGRPLGALAGIPIGVKDIYAVAGLPTAYGVPGRRGAAFRGTGAAPGDFDAPAVAALKGRGAVVLGMTVSTPYAWIDPPPTRNPWDPGRTPGGSSSGSAAAVACGMCLGALGSQTGGSITRPASFCGVAGFKPTYGSRDAAGILPLAPSLDHPGPIARTVADLALLADVRPADPDGPPTIARLRGPFDDRAEPAMRAAMDRAVASLVEAGHRVIDLDPPGHFAESAAHHSTIMAAEAAEVHRIDRERCPELYPPRIAKLIDDGLRVSSVSYREAKSFQARFRDDCAALLHGADALLTPAALGPAPGPETTGDPAFNSPWSLAGLPTVAHPIGLSPEGLPLGLQLVGRPGPGGEAALFGVALRTEAALRRSAGAAELPPPQAEWR